MLLERLRELALADQDALPAGYQNLPVRYVMLIREDGTMLGITDTADRGANKRGTRKTIPFVKRSSGIRPQLITDHAEYVLGIGRESSKPDRVEKMYASWRELVQACYQSTNEPLVGAILRFLERPEQLSAFLPADFDPSATIDFSVVTASDPVGSSPVDRLSVQAFWANYLAPAEGEGSQACIVCGTVGPTLERHPLKIKGIPGGQVNKDLVSANNDAFLSYGLQASNVAPTCAACAEAYGNALNQLLSGKDTHFWTKELVWAFWTNGPENDQIPMFGVLTEPPEHPGEVRNLLQAWHKGDSAPLAIREKRFYAVALGASGARVVVKDWIDTTVGAIRQSLGRYFAYQQTVAEYASDTDDYLPIWRLTGATVRRGDTPPSIVSQSLIRFALAGTPLPMDLLYLAVRRNRADQNVNRERAALIKMVLASQSHLSPEEAANMSGLNRQDTRPAYVCGRLLAVLEKLQGDAIGNPNATIVDRYYGSASSTPAIVFPALIKGSQHHLGRLRRARPGAYITYQRRIQELTDALGMNFPGTLSLIDQGVFSLGYYHQRAELFRPHDTSPVSVQPSETVNA